MNAAASILAPLSGVVIPVTVVPDPVFSQKKMGEGVAIRPLAQVQPVLAPVSGKVDINKGRVRTRPPL